jgi:serine protease Do
MKEPLSRTDKNAPGMATFSTKPGRPYNLKLPIMPAKKPSAPQIFKTRLASMVGIILICFVVGFGGGWLGAREYNHGNRTVASSTAAKQQFISDESSLIASIAKNVGQSVVSIDVQGQATTQDFFGFGQTQTTEAAGTGFIISNDGIIVTNRHVVPSGTTSVSVTMSDGTTFDNVQVVGRTSNSSSQDVAFLKIGDLKGKTLTPVTLADSSKVQVGDRVVAIGNALGQFQNTVTSGIISGFGRDVTAGDQSGAQSNENLTDLFQTDAAINEGNSGGPLVNINGEVIGINTAIASDAQNIGFAQPINDVKGLISSVLDGGKLEQPYLGVRYVSLTNDIAKEFNLKTARGAYVTSGSGQDAVVSGSPADKAGIEDHDVIKKVNNITIDDKTSLTAALSRFKVGDKVTLTIVRGDKTITKDATLGSVPKS